MLIFVVVGYGALFMGAWSHWQERRQKFIVPEKLKTIEKGMEDLTHMMEQLSLNGLNVKDPPAAAAEEGCKAPTATRPPVLTLSGPNSPEVASREDQEKKSA